MRRLVRNFALTLLSLSVQAASSPAPVGQVPFTARGIPWPDETSDISRRALRDLPAQAGNAFRLPLESSPATLGDLLAMTGAPTHRSLGLIPTIAPDEWLEGLTPMKLEREAFPGTSSSAATDNGLNELLSLPAAAGGQAAHWKQWGSSPYGNHSGSATPGGNHSSSRTSTPQTSSRVGDHGERNNGERGYGEHFGSRDLGTLDYGALDYGGNYTEYKYGEPVASLPVGSYPGAVLCADGPACRNPLQNDSLQEAPSVLATPEPSGLVLFGLSIGLFVPLLWRFGVNKGDKSHPYGGLLPVHPDARVTHLRDPQS
jgi:hypothetical protein